VCPDLSGPDRLGCDSPRCQPELDAWLDCANLELDGCAMEANLCVGR